jgi:hypothetical protein
LYVHNKSIIQHKFPFLISQKDTKSAGCYNLECAGFVPATGAALRPGQAVAPQSTYGEADRYIRLSLNKVLLFPNETIYEFAFGMYALAKVVQFLPLVNFVHN